MFNHNFYIIKIHQNKFKTKLKKVLMVMVGSGRFITFFPFHYSFLRRPPNP